MTSPSPSVDRALLPCPFCGSEELHAFKHTDSEPSFGFQCSKCWMTSSHHSTEAEAIAAWNTRATPSYADAIEDAAKVAEGYGREGRNLVENICCVISTDEIAAEIRKLSPTPSPTPSDEVKVREIAEAEARRVCVEYRLNPQEYEKHGGKHPLQPYIEEGIMRALAAHPPAQTVTAEVHDALVGAMFDSAKSVSILPTAKTVVGEDARIQIVKDIDVPRGAWDWIEAIGKACDGPHVRLETPSDAESIVLWHYESPAAVVLNLRDQFNRSVQFRIDLRSLPTPRPNACGSSVNDNAGCVSRNADGDTQAAPPQPEVVKLREVDGNSEEAYRVAKAFRAILCDEADVFMAEGHTETAVALHDLAGSLRNGAACYLQNALSAALASLEEGR